MAAARAEGVTPPKRTRRRRLLWAFLVLLIVALAVAGGLAGYVGKTNLDRAKSWERTAARLDAKTIELSALLDRRTAELNDRTEQLNDMAAQVESFQRALERSEADVRNLERRQRQLAREKAQVEDQRAQLAVEQQVLLEQQAALTGVLDAMVDCNIQLGEAYDALLFEDYVLLDIEIEEANAACNQAGNQLGSYNAIYG